MNNILALPVLDELHTALVSGTGTSTCKAPVSNGSFQVGFHGKPDTFDPIGIEAPAPAMLTFDFSDHAITGPVRNDDNGRITRLTTRPWGTVNLVKTHEGNWAIAGNDDELPTPKERLVLSRTLAKVGERALKQI